MLVEDRHRPGDRVDPPAADREQVAGELRELRADRREHSVRGPRPPERGHAAGKKPRKARRPYGRASSVSGVGPSPLGRFFVRIRYAVLNVLRRALGLWDIPSFGHVRCQAPDMAVSDAHASLLPANRALSACRDGRLADRPPGTRPGMTRPDRVSAAGRPGSRGGFDARDQREAVLLVARDQRELDADVGDLERHAFAAVLDRDDVRATVGDVEQLYQLAGAIGEAAADEGSLPARMRPWRRPEMSGVGSMFPPESSVQTEPCRRPCRPASQRRRPRRRPRPAAWNARAAA